MLIQLLISIGRNVRKG